MVLGGPDGLGWMNLEQRMSHEGVHLPKAQPQERQRNSHTEKGQRYSHSEKGRERAELGQRLDWGSQIRHPEGSQRWKLFLVTLVTAP